MPSLAKFLFAITDFGNTHFVHVYGGAMIGNY